MRRCLIAAAVAVSAVAGCADRTVTSGAQAIDRRTEIWRCSAFERGASGPPTVALAGTLWAATGTVAVAGAPADLTDFGMSGPVRVWSWGGRTMRASQFHIGPDLTGVLVRFPDGRKSSRPESLHRCRLVGLAGRKA